jgi:hypothetical protein
MAVAQQNAAAVQRVVSKPVAEGISTVTLEAENAMP